MRGLCYNKNGSIIKKDKSRIEAIVALLKSKEIAIEAMERGRIEIHFAGKDVSASLQEFWK